MAASEALAQGSFITTATDPPNTQAQPHITLPRERERERDLAKGWGWGGLKRVVLPGEKMKKIRCRLGGGCGKTGGEISENEVTEVAAMEIKTGIKETARVTGITSASFLSLSTCISFFPSLRKRILSAAQRPALI